MENISVDTISRTKSINTIKFPENLTINTIIPYTRLFKTSEYSYPTLFSCTKGNPPSSAQSPRHALNSGRQTDVASSTWTVRVPFGAQCVIQNIARRHNFYPCARRGFFGCTARAIICVVIYVWRKCNMTVGRTFPPCYLCQHQLELSDLSQGEPFMLTVQGWNAQEVWL